MNLDDSKIPSALSSEEADRVFEVALSLVPAAIAFGRKFQLDSEAAQDAMMEAAERVVKSRGLSDSKTGKTEIRNLPAYLFAVARRLMFREIKRHREEVSIDDVQNSGVLLQTNQSDSFVVTILLSEAVERMSPKARAIFTLRTQGYAYKEIVKEFKKMGHKTTAASLRSELSKAFDRISKELEKAGNCP
jgi:RNA polymerase sigma factor (sigma-70 family)